MPQLTVLVQYSLLFLTAALSAVSAQDANDPLAAAQEAEDRRLTILMTTAKANHYDPSTNQEAIEIWKRRFKNATDQLQRETIASALVMLGQKENVYWSVLAARAQEIVSSPVPYPLVFDDGGKTIRDALTPEFVEWVRSHKVSADEALQEQIGMAPAELGLMASTGDPRGLTILRQGLRSPNLSVQWIAAKGLAKLQDNDSINQIIDDARRAPEDMKWPIAETLLFFDSPEAHAAAEELIHDKVVLQDTKKRAKEQGVYGIW